MDFGIQVHTLINPSVEKFGEAQQAVQPNLLYLQGQQLENEEIGSLAWGGTDLSDPQMLCSLISPPFPTIVSSKILLTRLHAIIAVICLTAKNETHKCTLVCSSYLALKKEAHHGDLHSAL